MTIPGVDEEEAVLGAILTQGEVYQEAAMILEENDFYKEEHRLIWRAMTVLSTSGKKIDPVAVCSMLREKQALTRAGGTSGVSCLMDILFDTSNVAEYAKSVKSASIGRQLKLSGRRLMNDSTSPTERLDAAFADLIEINRRAAYGRRVGASEITNNILSNIIKGNGFELGVNTGFVELDSPFNGLRKKSFYILGARPSVGKSALALQIARNVAAEGKRVLYCSPEMSNEQLGARLLSIESGVPYEDIVRANVKEDYEDSLREAGERIDNYSIIIDDSSVQTVSQIKLKARQELDRGLSLVIVDYLQLLCAGDDDKAAVTKISKGLKAVAKDLNIPVLACSQVRRRYGQEPRRPSKDRLKGSGQQEQDADGVMLMWYPDKENISKVEVFIDKHRNGRRGQTMLKFDAATTRFEETEVW